MSDDVSQDIDAVDEATEEYSKLMAMGPVNNPEKVANAGTNKKGGELETPRQETSDEAKAEDRAEDNSNSLKDLYQHGHATDDYWKVLAYHRYIQVVYVFETTSCSVFSLVLRLELATYVRVPTERSV